MTRRIFLIIIAIVFLTGCTRTSSLDGRIVEINEGFLLDCSEQVEQNVNSDTDEGYLCSVEITEKTILKDEDGEKLSINDFSRGDMVSVVLKKPKVIGQSKRSREVEAKEIILMR